MRNKTITLFLLFLFSAAALFAQERAVNEDGNFKGIIRVKLQNEVVKKLNNLHQKAGDINQLSSEQRAYVKTNIQELDERNSHYQAKTYKRVFRHAGKFEERHRAFNLHRWYEIEFSAKASVSEVVKEFQKAESVEIAEPVAQMHLTGIQSKKKTNSEKSLSSAPDDPRYDEQWHYNNTGQTGGTTDADIDLPEAWEVETGNSNVIVAIEDQGIDYDHPDLAGNMWINSGETPGNGVDDDNNGYVDDYYGYNFGDDQGEITPGDHGSHTGGTVAAETNNGTGVAGVAGGTGSGDGVRLMSIEVFGSSNQGGFAEGFTYAADMGAHISQNSWGGGGESQSINDAIDYFIANGGSTGSPMEGGVVVFAAGNDDVSSGSSTWPAQYESAIAVAATNHEDKKSYYSNYGTWVDISAPGGETNSSSQEGVLSTIDGSYDFYQGTSMACPHVSGVAALIVSNHAGNITPEEVRNRLLQYTDPIDDLNPDYTGELGSGRLNAYAAITGEAPAPPPASFCTSKGNDASYEWIAKVEIGDYTNSSSGQGYTDFTSETIELTEGQSYDITLTPGFSNSSYDEYWKIWIDYNNDTSFTSDELVYDAGSLSSTAVSGTISLPSGVTGTKRMRVSMKYNGEQTPCETFDYGEVEDYNVNITSGGGSDTEAPTAPSNLASSNITETSVDLTWDASTDNVGVDHYIVYQDGSSIGTTANTSYGVTGLTESTTYTFTVKAEDAAGNVSDASNALDVTTQSSADTEPPTAPTNLASSNITETSVDLTWDASTDNVGVDHYTVFQDGNSIGTTANTSYSVTGLTGATTYTFTVKAEDAAGNVSDASNALDVTTSDGSVTYCSSQGENSSYEWISKVEIGSFSNSSDAAGYTDFTGQTVNLTAGESVSITLTPGFSGSSYSEYWKIWIDYNQDGDFDDEGELVFDPGSMSQSAVSGTMNIASDASGTTRMRITMKYNGAPSPCETFSYGEVEDYTVSFGEPTAPTTPTGLTSTNVTSSGFTMTWDAVSNASSYNAQVREQGASTWTDYTGITSTSYDVTNLNAETTYEFRVQAVNSVGSSSYTTTQTVTTNAVSLTYCDSYGENTNYEWIDLVELGSISNPTSSDGGYADYTNLSTDLNPGSNVTIYVSAGFASSSYTEYWHVWIDFDQSGTFDSDEEIVSGSSSSADKLSASFDVPSDATLGQTRMRVTMKYNSAASPCETFTYGEVEDYTVNITTTQNYNITEFADAKQLSNEKGTNNIKVYPNPALNNINLEINAGTREGMVDIYTAQGSLMKSVPINGDFKHIDVSELPSGVYFIKVPDAREPFVKQFIKQ